MTTASALSPFSHSRIPPESPKAAHAYADYEAMGEGRSLAKLAAKYGRPPSYVRQLQRWSHDYGWVARVNDYERQQLEARRKKQQAAIEQMNIEHSLFGRTQLYRAVKYLEEHFGDENTTVTQAIALMKTSAELERLARGAATSRIEGDVAVVMLPKEYINITDSDEGADL